MPRIRDIAAVCKSKNAGPFELTIDVVFDELDDAESELARAGTWRGSPEKYDERMESLLENLDPERGAVEEAPRRIPEAA